MENILLVEVREAVAALVKAKTNLLLTSLTKTMPKFLLKSVHKIDACEIEIISFEKYM